MGTLIRPMTKTDLPAVKRICHAAFGTFLGAPDRQNFWTDRDYVYGRFGSEHVAGFTVEAEGEVVGSNFATRWGNVDFFGPVSIRRDRQGRGYAKDLVAAVSAQFDAWGTSHNGLFTFPHARSTWPSMASSAFIRGF